MIITPANAMFLFDKEGVMILTDIEGGKVRLGELTYDGKNHALLKRDHQIYLLKNISPLIRTKIKDNTYVTIVEKNGDDLRSYDVKVHMVKDLGYEDDWESYAQSLYDNLQANMSEADFERFLKDSEKIIDALES